MTKDLFEYATRSKLRFPSTKNDLTIEQLWDVPLRSNDNFNLNVIARDVNKKLAAFSEENFVDDTKKSVAHAQCEVALEIVKYVIDVKKEEEAAAKKKAEAKAEKAQLLEVLAEKEKGELSDLSVKDLKKRIAALGD